MCTDENLVTFDFGDGRYAVAAFAAEGFAAALASAERDVLYLVLAGIPSRAIAVLRGKSPRFIENQICSLMSKLGVNSREGLLRTVRRRTDVNV